MAMGFPGQCYLMIDGAGREKLEQTLHNTQPILQYFQPIVSHCINTQPIPKICWDDNDQS